MKSNPYIRCLILILVMCSPAFGWGSLGHQLIGDVAEEYLTPKTKEAITELLGDRSLADVANWADTIKGQRPETRPWHYANPEPGAESFVLERDNPEESRVVEQINLDLQVLKDPEATHVAKVEALMFMVHFVGDVHQPLHLGWEADRGGNSIEIYFDGHKTNLHSLWDSGLINHTELDRETYLAGLLRQINLNANNKVEWGRELDPVQWANESIKFAQSNAYVVPKNGRLGDAYYGHNIRVVNERLAMAGIRLAAVLNDLYDPADSLFVPPAEGVERIVYAFAVPSTNENIVRFRNKELFQAIDTLNEDQHFTVIFYQDGKLLEPPPPGLTRKPATDSVKKRVQEWISPDAGHLEPYSSKGDPMAVLRQAFRYKPDLIYLWLGDGKGMLGSNETLADLLNTIDKHNQSEAAINTLEWSLYPPSGKNRQPTVVESIAEHTGGEHRFYVNDDVVGR